MVAHVADTIVDVVAAAFRADTETTVMVNKATLYLQTRVRAHASGRPGPNVITGDYRRSITADLGLARRFLRRSIAVGEVYTTSPQGRRLEYGFVGPDSLGRVYNQPPFPHWAPAVAETEAYLTTLGTALLVKVIP